MSTRVKRRKAFKPHVRPLIVSSLIDSHLPQWPQILRAARKMRRVAEDVARKRNLYSNGNIDAEKMDAAVAKEQQAARRLLDLVKKGI